MDWHWPLTFHNSSFVEVEMNPNIEVIGEPLHDQQPSQHSGAAGAL